MGCFSFYANKIITTGEGGMVTTNDDALAERLRLLRNLAFEQPRFLHEHAGFNFRMTGYQAAMGLVAAATGSSRSSSEKRRVAHTYDALLEDVRGIRRRSSSTWARNVYWMYGVVLTEEFPLTRDELMARLAEQRHRVADLLLPDEHAAVPSPPAWLPGRCHVRSPSGSGSAGCTSPAASTCRTRRSPTSLA